MKTIFNFLLSCFVCSVSVLAQYGVGGSSPTGSNSGGGGGGGGGGSVTQGTTPWVGSLEVAGAELSATNAAPVKPGTGAVFSQNIAQYLGATAGASNAVHVQPGTGAIFGMNIAQYLGATASASNAIHVQPGTGATFGTNMSQYSGSAVGASNAIHVQPGTGATFGMNIAQYLGATASSTNGVHVQPAREMKCSQSALFNVTSTGNTQIVSLTSGQSIRVCHISWSGDAVTDFKMTYGTGTNCGTGTTDLSGTYKATTGLAIDFGMSPLVGAASNAVCVNVTAGNMGGTVMYEKY